MIQTRGAMFFGCHLTFTRHDVYADALCVPIFRARPTQVRTVNQKFAVLNMCIYNTNKNK
jgi:hypothetical protein